jgi:hypothetical protein
MVRLAPFADVAQLEERGHAMAEATSSRLVIRSKTALASAVRLPGASPSAGTAMRPGKPTSGVSMHSEATRHGVGGPGCARSLARPRAARHHIRRDARVWAQPKWKFKKPSSSSRFEGGNRPQRLGGAGTRDRMEKHCLVNSVARVPACLVGSRGFESRTGRQISLPR